MRKIKSNFFVSLDGVVESPLVVGEGMARLFPAEERRTPLELRRSAETFKSGVLNLSYARAVE